MSADPVETMLCRWAEDQFGHATVVAVDFAFEDDGDYSEVTPGDGPYMSITVTYLGRGGGGSRQHTTRHVRYDTALIREILRHAVGGAT